MDLPRGWATLAISFWAWTKRQSPKSTPSFVAIRVLLPVWNKACSRPFILIRPRYRQRRRSASYGVATGRCCLSEIAGFLLLEWTLTSISFNEEYKSSKSWSKISWCLKSSVFSFKSCSCRPFISSPISFLWASNPIKNTPNKHRKIALWMMSTINFCWLKLSQIDWRPICLVWILGSGKALWGDEGFRIPWGSGMAGSSPSSLKMSSKDWWEIWRAGMPYCSPWGG